MQRDKPNREFTHESVLTIRLFGGMAIVDTAGVDYLPRSRKARAIVALLTLTAPKSMQRGQLTSLLWSQRGNVQGRSSLRQAVHELQQTFGTAWNQTLVAERHSLSMNLRGVAVDALEAVAATVPEARVLMLIQGGFLEDLIGLDPAFDIWLDKERRRMVAIARIEGEASLEEPRDREATIRVARSLLRLDPTHAAAWRALISALIEAGDRAAARFACEQWGEAMGVSPDDAPPRDLASFLARIRFGSDYRPPGEHQNAIGAGQISEDTIVPDHPSKEGGMPDEGDPVSGGSDAGTPRFLGSKPRVPGADGIEAEHPGTEIPGGSIRDEAGRPWIQLDGVYADGVTPGRIMPEADIPLRTPLVRALSDDPDVNRTARRQIPLTDLADRTRSGTNVADGRPGDPAGERRTATDPGVAYEGAPGALPDRDTHHEARSNGLDRGLTGETHSYSGLSPGVVEQVVSPGQTARMAAMPGRVMPDTRMPDRPRAAAGSQTRAPETWDTATAPWHGASGRRSILRLGIREMRVIGPNVDRGLPAGLAEEVTTALSRFEWLACVSGSSHAAIAGESGEESISWTDLDLDLLLDGTIQGAGEDRVRITVRLLDMRASESVIWAKRFSHDASDTLTVQDRVAAMIVAQLDPLLLIREGERAATRNPRGVSARDLVLQAVPAIYRMDRPSFHAAGELLEAALRLDPTYSSALAWLAYWHLFLVGQGWADDPEAATRRAGLLADAAVAMDPNDARALTLAGHVRGFLLRRPAEAAVLHDRAISLNPNLAIAWCFSGFTLCYLGDHAAALVRMAKAIELSPSDPHLFFFQAAVIMPHLLLGEYELAAKTGRRAIELNPWFSSTFKGCLAALGHLGLTKEASSVRGRLLKMEPTFTVRDAIRRSPMSLPADIERYAEGLRRGGLPED